MDWIRWILLEVGATMLIAGAIFLIYLCFSTFKEWILDKKRSTTPPLTRIDTCLLTIIVIAMTSAFWGAWELSEQAAALSSIPPVIVGILLIAGGTVFLLDVTSSPKHA